MGGMERDELELAVVEGALQGVPAEPARVARLARLLGWDERVLLHFRRYHGPWRTRIARLLTRAGDARSFTIAALALLALGRPATVHVGLRLAAGSALGALAAQVLKRSLNRRRPSTAIEGFEALLENPDALLLSLGPQRCGRCRRGGARWRARTRRAGGARPGGRHRRLPGLPGRTLPARRCRRVRPRARLRAGRPGAGALTSSTGEGRRPPPRWRSAAPAQGTGGCDSGRTRLTLRSRRNCTSVFCRLAALRVDLREGRAPSLSSSA